MQVIEEKARIVFLPDYMVTTLKANKISLEEIDTIANAYIGTKDYSIVNSFKERIANKLSITDLTDMIAINDVVYKSLLKINRYDHDSDTVAFLRDVCEYAIIDKSNYNWNLTKYELKILNILMCSHDTDDGIIVSGDKNKNYDILTTEHTMFVVLHEGFGNILIGNDENKTIVLKDLLDYAIKRFSYDSVKNTSLFKQFIRLV